jgi:L,D-transpeptidase YcbB
LTAAAQGTRPAKILVAEPGLLQQSIEHAQLPGMVHPKFAELQREVREFYAQSGNSFQWVQSAKPTPEALTMIQLFQNSDNDGLNSKDYDGPLWGERVAALRHQDKASSADLVLFDLALTICTMRYVSHLQHGRLDPP